MDPAGQFGVGEPTVILQFAQQRPVHVVHGHLPFEKSITPDGFHTVREQPKRPLIHYFVEVGHRTRIEV
ncbi:hypothetical protein GCM10010170_023810 [Dactylosporangium salmoneum]|uniref:Calcineurin-like phosphoesterase domain-containing protein n=1 Tax=Dactylosporangium salmoneum TaxID=53361 RepID=A0ABP5SXL2_9ACTN